ELYSALIRGRCHGVQRGCYDGSEVDRLTTKNQFSFADAAGVEQILDELGQRSSATFNRRHGLDADVVAIDPFHHLRPTEDRGQWCPQLVRGDRQESILDAVCLAGLFVQRRVLDRVCDLLTDELDKLDFVHAELAIRSRAELQN